MTELLDRYLDRLVEGAGADVAVIWSRTGLATTASVVSARPAGLVAVEATGLLKSRQGYRKARLRAAALAGETPLQATPAK